MKARLYYGRDTFDGTKGDITLCPLELRYATELRCSEMTFHLPCPNHCLGCSALKSIDYINKVIECDTTRDK